MRSTRTLSSDASRAVRSALGALDCVEHFRDAAAPTKEYLAAWMIRRKYPAGGTIFWEQDATGPAFLVESGLVRITSMRPDGKDHFLSEARPWSVIGDASALLGCRRPATARAVEPTEVWEIPALQLKKVIEKDPRLAFAVVLQLMEALRAQETAVAIRAGQSAQQRVAHALLGGLRHGVDSNGRSWPTEITHEDIALLAGITRECASRALGGLRRKNLISTQRRQVVILDEPGLRRLAGWPEEKIPAAPAF